MELMDSMTPQSREICVVAGQEALSAGCDAVRCQHLLVALTHIHLYTDRDLGELMGSIEMDEMRREAERLTGSQYRAKVQPLPFSDDLSALLSEVTEGQSKVARRVKPRDLFLALVRQAGRPSSERGSARLALKRMLSEKGMAEQMAEFIARNEKTQGSSSLPRPSYGAYRDQNQKLSLDELTDDLVAAAHQGLLPAVAGRDNETEELLQTLMRSRKNTAVLVGEPGVGKTAIVEGLAGRIATGQVPDRFAASTILSLDVGTLVSGTRYRGDFEERMKGLLEELRENRSQTILFIDEIHSILGAGSSSDSRLDAATMLKPALARGEIQLIGATTPHEYEQLLTDPAFERRLHPVWVSEPTGVQAAGMVRHAARDLKAHHQVAIPAACCDQAVELTERFIPQRRLPDKAIDLLDAAGALAASSGAKTISQEHLCQVLSGWCSREIHPRQVGPLDGLRDRMNDRVLGQEKSVALVCSQLEVSMLGLNERRGPLASFLLAGPPGVGKSETARALAHEVMGDAESLLRFDMSEFPERHDLTKLLGAPPGYVGFENGSSLTEQLRHNPHRVLLFDEVEKAHPDVLSILLQGIEEGQITDGRSNKADLRHCIVLMTSNLGSENTYHPTGFASSECSEDRVHQSIRSALRPELLDRLDGICIYQPLNDDALDELMRRALSPLRRELRKRGATLKVTGPARSYLREQCRLQSGARGLGRLVERQVSTPVAQLLLAATGNFSRVTVDYREKEIRVSRT